MGWFSDFVSNPLGTVVDTVSNPVQSVSNLVQGAAAPFVDPFTRGDITPMQAALLAAGGAGLAGYGPLAGLGGLGTGAAGGAELAGYNEAVAAAQAAAAGLPGPSVGASGLFSTLGGQAGRTLLGAGLQGLSGYGAVNQARNAANQQASDTIRAAQIAADASKFRPVGVTTRFGASNFQYDPQGNLVGAGYQVAPALAGLQDTLLGQATGGGAQSAAQAQQAQQSLFNLGQQYLAQSPEQAAQQYIEAQRRLLQPGRDVSLANLRQGMFNTGRTGLSIAQGGEMGAANPEAQAYYNALAQQEAQLASDALTKGQQQVQFGANLFGQGADVFNAGLRPMQSAIGTAGTIENLGQNALDIGSALGGRVTQGNQAGAAGLLNAGGRAAELRGQASAVNPNAALLASLAANPQFLQAGQDAIGGLFRAGQGIYNDIFA